jgi:hypothetical protein
MKPKIGRATISATGLASNVAKRTPSKRASPAPVPTQR